MIWIGLLLSCCVLVNGAYTNDTQARWKAYKHIFQKSYDKNDSMRYMIWQRNVKFIQMHNLDADLGMYSYILGVNEFTDMMPDEVTHSLCGLRTSNQTTDINPHEASDDLFVPDTIDWRTKGYVTPVKYQGRCGSCWAFSATGSLEGQHYRKTGKLVSLSEQNLVDCSRPEGNKGCRGGNPSRAFKYVKKNRGIDTSAKYHYTAKDGKCHYKPVYSGCNCTGYRSIKSRDEKALMHAVATVGPISVSIDSSRSTFHMYRSGVYDDPKCSSQRLNHAVLVVGYGKQNDIEYWLVKNSWGKSWGDHGYIKMSRNKKNQCGIANEPTYPRM